MVAIITGNDLGLLNSSMASLGANGINGNSQLGQSNEGVFVNASQGNLIIQRQDEILVGMGVDLRVLRTYNSQGTFEGDINQKWRIGVARLEIDGNRITRIASDNSDSIFDLINDTATSTEGSGAHDKLVRNADGSYSWTDGNSLLTENYDQSGRLISRVDEDENTITYSYVNDQLTTISNTQQSLTFTYANGNVSGLVLSDGDTAQQRFHYGYDAQGRLNKVSVDFTPEDFDVSDNGAFETIYTYEDETSLLIKNISNSDGTNLTFTYIAHNGIDKVATVTDGNGNVTSFDYSDSGQTSVTNPNQQTSVLYYDDQGQLIKTASPAVNGQPIVNQYFYDSEGNVVRVVNPNGHYMEYEYDANGNQVLSRDNMGNTISRTYNSSNQITSETTYAIADPDGAGTLSAGEGSTTFYLYDEESHLRFLIGPDGSVVESEYNNEGNISKTIAYRDQSFQLSASAPTYTDLVNWREAIWVDPQQDKSGIQLTVNEYNLLGQLDHSITYAQLNADGSVVGDGSKVQFIYNQYGQVTQTIDANNQITQNHYDSMGRLELSVNALQEQTVVQYDDAQNRIITTQANGLVTTRVYDGAGRLISQTQVSSESENLGSALYIYDDSNRLVATQDAAGIRNYTLYDDAGRPVATIDANGQLIENVYDKAGNLVKTIAYSSFINTQSFISPQGEWTNVELATIRPINDADLRQNWLKYDSADRLIFTIDAEGYITESIYNGRSQITDTIAYSTAIDTSTLDSITTNEVRALLLADAISVTSTVIVSSDNITTGYVNWANDLPANSGLFVRSSGLGFNDFTAVNLAGDSFQLDLTDPVIGRHNYEVEVRDLSTGQVIKQATGAITLSDGTHQDLLIYSAGAQDTQNRQQRFFYDELGRQVGVLDGEGYFTRNVFNHLGQLTHTISYALKVTDTTASEINQLGISLDVDNDQETSYLYNNQGLLIATVDAEGYLTERQYDVANRLTAEIRYNQKARVENGNLLNDIRPLDTSDIQSQSYTYDALDRVETEVSHLGLTKTYSYDAQGNVTRVDYAAADIQDRSMHNTYDQLGRLTGSLDAKQSDDLGVSPTLAAIKAAIQSSGTQYQYDELGLRISATDPNGLKTLYFYDDERQLRFSVNADGEVIETRYNAFGEVSETLSYNQRLNQLTVTDFNLHFGEGVDSINDLTGGLTSPELISLINSLANGGVQTTQINYDTRGLIKTTTDAEGYGVEFNYNSFAEEVVRTQYLDKANSEGTATRFEYDNRGLLKTSIDALGNKINNDYDAFGRLTRLTNALGQTTEYGYDKNGRQVVITDAQGGKYYTTYDAFNRTLTTTDRLGNTTTYLYDLATKTNTITFADNSSSRSVYNALEETTESYDGLDNLTSFTFDLNGQLTHITDAQGNVTESRFDEGGRLVTTIDQKGSETTYAYDAAGRVLTQIEDVNGLIRTTSYQYDGAGNSLSVTDANDNTTFYVYDDLGQTRFVVDAENFVTENVYDSKGQIVAVNQYYEATSITDFSASALQAWTQNKTSINTRYIYDAIGQVRFEINAEGFVSENRYDAEGQLLRQLRYHDKFVDSEATEAGLASWKVNRESVSSNYIYDSLGRVRYEINAEGFVTENEYDANGNLNKQITFQDLNINGESITNYISGGESHENFTVYDNNPAGATVTSVFDQDKGSSVVLLSGSGLANGYRLGGDNGVDWDNEKETILSWDAKFDENYNIFVLINTDKGLRSMRYLVGNGEPHFAGNAITHYISPEKMNGEWHTVEADLRADLLKFEPDNNFVSTKEFFIYGSGLLDNIQLKGSHEEASIDSIVSNYTGEKSEITYVYDSLDRVQIVVDAEGNVSENLYDAASNLIETKQYRDLTISTSETKVTSSYFSTGDTADNHRVFDNLPAGATVTTVYDSEKQGEVLQLSGEGLANGYEINGPGGLPWNNTSEFNFSMDFKFNEVFIFYIHVETNQGAKTLRYSQGPFEPRIDGNNFDHYLSASLRDGNWHTFERDLAADLTSLDPSIELLSVKNMRIRGSGQLDNIQLYNIEPPQDIEQQVANSVSEYTSDRYLYNELNQMRFSVDALGYVTETVYDERGQVIDIIEYADPLTSLEPLEQILSSAGTVPSEVELPLNWVSVPPQLTVVDDSVSNMTGYSSSAFVNLQNKLTDGTGYVEFTVPEENTNAFYAFITVKENDYITSHYDFERGIDIYKGGAIALLQGETDGSSIARSLDDTYRVYLNGSDILAQVKRSGGEYETFHTFYNVVNPTSEYTVNISINGGDTTVDDIRVVNDLTSGEGQGSSTVDLGASRSQSFIYDDLERLRYTIDALGYVFENQYDAFGQVVKTVRHELVVPSNLRTVDAISGYLTENAASNNPINREYVYDDIGRQRFEIDAQGYLTESTYDINNQVVASQRWETAVPSDLRTVESIEAWLAAPLDEGVAFNQAITSRYVYNDLGQQRFMIDADGYVSESRFDSRGNIETTISYRNAYNGSNYDLTSLDAWRLLESDFITNHAIYDGLGRPVYTVDGDGYVTHNEYDGLGNLVKMTEFASSVDTTVSEWRNNFAVTSSQDDRTTIYISNSKGQLEYVIDADGYVSQRVYDAFDQIIETKRYSQQLVVTVGDWTAETIAAALTAGTEFTQTTRVVYDDRGQVRFTVDAEGYVTENIYDAFGNAVKSIAYAQDYTASIYSESELANWATTQVVKIETESAFDSLNRLQFALDGEGSVIENRYDDFGRVVETIQYAETYADINSAITSIQNSTGDQSSNRSTKFVYDSLDRVRFTIDAGNYLSENRYDDFGRLSETFQYSLELPVQSTYTAEEINALLNPVVESQPPKTINIQFDENDTFTDYKLDSPNNDIVIVNNSATFKRSAVATTPGDIRINHAGVPSDYQALSFEFTTDSFENGGGGLLASLENSQESTLKYTHGVNIIGYQAIINSTSAGVAGPTQTVNLNPFTTYVVEYDITSTNSTITVYEKGTSKALGTSGTVNINDADWGNQTLMSFSALNGISTEEGEIYLDNINVVANASAGGAETPEIISQRTAYAYDARGNVISIEDAANNVESYTYDAFGNKESFENKRNKVWTYKYDGRNNLTDEISPEVSVASSDGSDPVVREIVRHFEYDAFGNVSSITEDYQEATFGTAESRTTNYVYDKRGNQTVVTHSDQGHYVVDTTNNIDGVVAKGERATNETKYNAYGLAVVNIDELGYASYKTYNENNQVEFEIDSEGYVTRYQYDGYGNVSQTKRFAVSIFNNEESEGQVAAQLQALDVELRSEDIDGLLIPNGNSDRVVDYKYDALGRKTQEKQAVVEGFNSDIKAAFTAAPEINYSYNAFGQLVKQSVRINGGSSTANSYTYYDELGRVVATFDQVGFLTEFEYDSFGNMVKKTEFSQKIEVTYDSEFNPSVDENNQPSGVVHEDDRITSYQYDELNRLNTTTLIDVNVSRISGSLIVSEKENVVNKTEYDELGRIIAHEDSTGQRATTTYDVLGRVKAVTQNAKDVALNASLDPFISGATERASLVTEYSYNAFGHLLQTKNTSDNSNVKGGNIITRNVVDYHGNVVKTIDAVGHEVIMQYNAKGLITQTSESVIQNTYEDYWETVNYETVYYNQDRPGLGSYQRPIRELRTNQLTPESYSFTKVQNYKYDSNGQQIESTINATNLEGVERDIVTVTSYNAFGEIATKGLKDKQGYSYEYDQAGRLIRSNEGNGVYKNYSYNLLGQMTREIQEGDQATSSDDRYSYFKYDLNGRTTHEEGVRFTASENDINPGAPTLTTPVTIQEYDRWGNVISITDALSNVTNYRFNKMNQVIEETKAAVSYWDETGSEVENFNATTTHYYDARGLRVGVQDAAGYYSSFEYDETGLMTKSTDNSGKVTEYAYDIHGRKIATKDALGFVKTNEYNANGQVTSQSILRNYQSYSFSDYTSGGDITNVREAVISSFAYDTMGNRYAEFKGSQFKTDFGGSEFILDEEGNLQINYDDLVTLNAFDTRGNIVMTSVANSTLYDLAAEEDAQFLSATYTYEFDDLGNKVGEYHANEKSLTWEFDDYGLLRQSKNLADTITTHQYDGHAQLTKSYVDENNQYREFEYYENGLLKSIADYNIVGDRGTEIVPRSDDYRLDQYKDSYEYDVLGRQVVSKTENLSEYADEQFSVDANDNAFIEKIISTDAYDSTSYSQYDAVGRLEKFVANRDGEGNSVDLLENRYDERGNKRATIATYQVDYDPGESVVPYQHENWHTYDKDNRILITVGELVNGEIIAKESASYDDLGQRTGQVTYKQDYNIGNPPEYGLPDTLYTGKAYEELIFSYDDLGNIDQTQARVKLKVDSTYYHSGLHNVHLTTFDNWGRATNDTRWTLEWDTTPDRIGDAQSVANELLSSEKTSRTFSEYNSANQIISQINYSYEDNTNREWISSRVNFSNGYDLAGNQLAYSVSVFKMDDTIAQGELDYKIFYNQKYIEFDSYKLKESVVYSKSGTAETDENSSTHNYNYRGDLLSVKQQEEDDPSKSFEHFYQTNRSGKIVNKVQVKSNSTKHQSYFYHNGQGVADVGSLKLADFDYNQKAFSTQVKQASPSLYVVGQGDTLERIAQTVYGNSSLWYVIAEANGVNSDEELTEGMSLTIPAHISNTNNADTFRPYNPGEIIGDTSPIAEPPPPPEAGCDVISTLLIVAVVAIATVYTAGAVSGKASATVSTWEAGLAALGGEYGAVVMVDAAFVSGMAGNAAGQVAGNALGVRDGYSLREVFASGVSAGATAGITIGVAGGPAADLADKIKALDAGQKALIAAASVLTSAAANKSVGLPSGFRWSNVAASAATAAIGHGLGLGSATNDNDNPQRFLNSGGLFAQTFNGVANAAINYSVKKGLFNEGSWDTKSVVANAFGNALGNSIVSSLLVSAREERIKNLQREQRSFDIANQSINDAIADINRAKQAEQQAQNNIDSSVISIDEIVGRLNPGQLFAFEANDAISNIENKAAIARNKKIAEWSKKRTDLESDSTKALQQKLDEIQSSKKSIVAMKAARDARSKELHDQYILPGMLMAASHKSEHIGVDFSDLPEIDLDSIGPAMHMTKKYQDASVLQRSVWMLAGGYIEGAVEGKNAIVETVKGALNLLAVNGFEQAGKSWRNVGNTVESLRALADPTSTKGTLMRARMYMSFKQEADKYGILPAISYQSGKKLGEGLRPDNFGPGVVTAKYAYGPKTPEMVDWQKSSKIEIVDDVPNRNPLSNYSDIELNALRGTGLNDAELTHYLNTLDDVHLFRGTTEGFAGNPVLQQLGISPASLDPAISTVFALEGKSFGSAVLQFGSRKSFGNPSIDMGNNRNLLEREIQVNLSPTDFAGKAPNSISADAARQILDDMNVINLPPTIRNTDHATQILESYSAGQRMTPEQIQEFLRRASQVNGG